MKCPKCKHELEVTRQERLETLGEHVCDPNGTPSLKDLYQCVNIKCKCFRAFGWNTWGFLWRRFKHQKQSGDKRAFEPSRNKAWVYLWFHTFISIRYYVHPKT